MQLHLYWPTWGHDGYWMEELQPLKQAGKARSVGISIPDHRHDSAISLVESGRIDSVQTILNIFDSEPLDTLIPICQANHVAVIARCILDEGGLTGSLTEDAEFPPGDFRHGYFDWTVPRRRTWQGRRAAPLRSRHAPRGGAGPEVRHPPPRSHHGHHVHAR